MIPGLAAMGMPSLDVLPHMLKMFPPHIREAFAGICDLATTAHVSGPRSFSEREREHLSQVSDAHGIPLPLVCALAALDVQALPSVDDVGEAIWEVANGDPRQVCALAGAYLFYLLREVPPEKAESLAGMLRG